mgnify:CR=1 FL=1
MLPCHIVRDLLPSYLEHLTGPETEADICEHLESCPDCRAARDAMAADLKAEKAPPPKLNFSAETGFLSLDSAPFPR